MKKTLSLIAIASSLLLTSQASAKDGFYVGADLVLSNAKYKYHNKTNEDYTGGERYVGKIDGNGVGTGVSMGYKKSFNQVFIAPEIFYDYLNLSSKDYFHVTAPYHQDTMELRSRYGAKANFGYDFNKSFSAYFTYGLANVSYINRVPSSNRSEGEAKISQIYGLGAMFKINDSWAVKAEFNQQKFNARYFNEGVISKVRLDVFKTGLVYNF